MLLACATLLMLLPDRFEPSRARMFSTNTVSANSLSASGCCVWDIVVTRTIRFGLPLCCQL